MNWTVIIPIIIAIIAIVFYLDMLNSKNKKKSDPNIEPEAHVEDRNPDHADIMK